MVAAVLLTTAYGTALGLVSAYHVDPVTAAWSRWTNRRDALSEIITCNFDSIAYVELLTGDSGSTGRGYRVGILEGDVELTHADGTQHQPTSWVRFEEWSSQIAFTKGKKYEFRFTRTGSDSIQYYYQNKDPYPCGLLVAPNLPDSVPLTWDLAMRVYGRMNAVDSSWYGVTNHYFDPAQSSGGANALDTAVTMGIRWIRDDLSGWNRWRSNPSSVAAACNDYVSRGFALLGVLCYGSSDSAIGSYPRSAGGSSVGWPWNYPPRNLWPDSNQTNYWAEYCDSIVGTLDDIECWEVWNEPNGTWCWNDPDTAYYKGGTPGPNGQPEDSFIDAPRERCSLYVRMCYLAKQSDTTKDIVAGVVWRLCEPSEPIGETSSGVNWLKDMFDLAERYYGGAEHCFDVVSVHPYMHLVDTANTGAQVFWFKESLFAIDLDTARWVMRQAGYPEMELWASEIGWPRWYKEDSSFSQTDTLQQARDLCEFYTSAVARQADPRGGYDRAFWYELTGYRTDLHGRIQAEGFGLLDSLLIPTRMPQAWAYKRWEYNLVGKRLNGRVMADDTAADSHARMYEFEDMSGRRTWVCWMDGDAKRGVEVKLPVRTNSLAAESLAYTRTPPAFSPRVKDDGWLSMILSARPVFISERTAPQRPDLRVDSVRVVQSSLVVVRAWVTNHGTRATPVRSGSRVAYPTWAVLRANGDSLAQAVRTTSVATNQAELKRSVSCSA